MPLTLRPTGLASPAYRDWADYIVLEDGRAVGRIYEDRHTLPNCAVLVHHGVRRSQAERHYKRARREPG